MEFEYKLTSIVKTTYYDLVKPQRAREYKRKQQRKKKKIMRSRKKKTMGFALKINDITKQK